MSRRYASLPTVAVLAIPLASPVARAQEYDVVLRGGTVHDGSGRPPVGVDAAVRGETIAAVGDPGGSKGHGEIAARRRAIAPGSISMLSRGPDSPLADGRSRGEIRRGVTLEILGEGESDGRCSDGARRWYVLF